jgi:hypothetical protein
MPREGSFSLALRGILIILRLPIADSAASNRMLMISFFQLPLLAGGWVLDSFYIDNTQIEADISGIVQIGIRLVNRE